MMNNNIKIARQLVRIAKELIAYKVDDIIDEIQNTEKNNWIKRKIDFDSFSKQCEYLKQQIDTAKSGLTNKIKSLFGGGDMEEKIINAITEDGKLFETLCKTLQNASVYYQNAVFGEKSPLEGTKYHNGKVDAYSIIKKGDKEAARDYIEKIDKYFDISNKFADEIRGLIEVVKKMQTNIEKCASDKKYKAINFKGVSNSISKISSNIEHFLKGFGKQASDTSMDGALAKEQKQLEDFLK